MKRSPGCNCCDNGECTCEQARSHYSSLTTITLSNAGSHGGGTDVLHEADTCTEVPNPRPENPLTGSALFGGSATIGATECVAQFTARSCAPQATLYGWDGLYSRCRDGLIKNYDWIGFFHGPSATSVCSGKPLICSKTASVVFSCDEGGNKQYHLRIEALIYLGAGSLFSSQLFTPDPSWPDLAPAGPGVDWTVTSNVYTRNGSTVDDGAQVAYAIDFAIPSNANQPLRLLYSAATWKKNATSVSMWTPNPSIDISGFTQSGTATVS